MSQNNDFNHLGGNLAIQYLQCRELTPYKNNPRKHSKHQIRQLARSIQEFGFTNPVLVDAEEGIIAGHGRVEAALSLGMEKVPVIYLDHLTEAQKRAYIIADNKLAENAGWDAGLLKVELEALSVLDAEFDLTMTGFEIEEIDDFLKKSQPPAAEELLIKPSERPVTVSGDFWKLGSHRVLCADATDPVSYWKLLEFQKAQMVFTDPPYNVPISGHVCGNGAQQHDEFRMASGEMSKAEFTAFLNTVFQRLCNHTTDGSLHYICMDWRHIQELTQAGEVYSEFKNLCVWNKTNGGMGSLYRSKHELVFVYKHGKEPHINNINLGKNGRYRTNVWDYAGVNTFENTENLKLHPTVKPVALVQDAILDCTKRGDIVLDPFGGSGSTLIAAERCGRTAFLMELEPKYVDVIIRRYQELTGDAALHADGKTFDQKTEERHVGL